MRLPNGYGGVSKLTGNRRNPWRVRVTAGWCDNTGKQLYKSLGYYKTRQQALNALAEHNVNPINGEPLTFSQVYSKWSVEKYPTISKSNVCGYKSSYSLCESIYNIKFSELRKTHLQHIVDNCDKSYNMLCKLKVLFSQLFKYAREYDICNKDYSSFVNVNKFKDNVSKNSHNRFTTSEVACIWRNVENNEQVFILLMLIYSGVRISELLGLLKENVNLKENWFDVTISKTTAGIRRVPIADKVKPFFEYWYNKNNSIFLLTAPIGGELTYSNYYTTYWKPLLKQFNLEHTPHDTRHTTVSMLRTVGVSNTMVQKIIGHAGNMTLTEKVYTEFEFQEVLKAINSI